MALKGSTNEEKIWNYLKSKGLNNYGIAGLMGNLRAESGLRPENLQNSYEIKLGLNDTQYTTKVDDGSYTNFVRDKAGYGLAQWTYWSRKQNLLNFAQSKKKSIGDLEMQLDFLYKELSEGYKTVLAVLKSATSVLEASNEVLLKFERPADQGKAVQNKRAQYGQEYYDKYVKNSQGGTIMSNSSLVTYTRISPNRTSPRNHKIDTITIHCYVGQVTAERGCNGSRFITYDSKNGASCNYVVGYDGSIGLCVEEKDRSWCSSNKANDHRAITIEVACETTHPYKVTDKAMAALIKLCADICKRNDIKELRWQGNKALVGQVDKQNMTVHRWFANKACPGDYLYNKHSYIAAEVNKLLGVSSSVPKTEDKTNDSFPAVPFSVRVLIDDLWIRKTPEMNDTNKNKYTKKGTFTIVEVKNGWGLLKSYQKNRNGWIWLGNAEYVTIGKSMATSSSTTKPSTTGVPFMIKVTASDLNIRKTPEYNSTNKTGKQTGKGSFTIVEVQQGTIDSKGTIGTWGLLKSYQKNRNGWVCLDIDCVEKI